MADLDLVVTTAAGRVARRLEVAAERLPGLTADAVEDLAADSELIFAAHAPSRSGRLARGVAAHVTGMEALVTATARNPETQYDYVGVTRFGHRVAFIVPKVASVLRFTTRAGRIVFARRVRGHRPGFDWRDRAMPQVEARTQIIATRLGRQIVARG